MSEELVRELIEAINKNTEAIKEKKELKILTRKELQKELGLGSDTMQKIFEDPNFKAQRMGKQDFATIEAVNDYLTNYRHERSGKEER